MLSAASSCVPPSKKAGLFFQDLFELLDFSDRPPGEIDLDEPGELIAREFPDHLNDRGRLLHRVPFCFFPGRSCCSFWLFLAHGRTTIVFPLMVLLAYRDLRRRS